MRGVRSKLQTVAVLQRSWTVSTTAMRRPSRFTNPLYPHTGRQKIEGSTNTAANGPSRSAQSAFENAKEQTGNTGPNVKARPASNDETPMVVENLRVTK